MTKNQRTGDPENGEREKELDVRLSAIYVMDEQLYIVLLWRGVRSAGTKIPFIYPSIEGVVFATQTSSNTLKSPIQLS